MLRKKSIKADTKLQLVPGWLHSEFSSFCSSVFSDSSTRTMYYLDIIILKLGKAPGMSGERVVAATHFCSLSWDRGPDSPGRTDVLEVSLQPLRENVIMRSLPPFFFHILARN